MKHRRALAMALALSGGLAAGLPPSEASPGASVAGEERGSSKQNARLELPPGAPPRVVEFAQRPMVSVMRQELARNLQMLRLPRREAPYYLAYWLAEYEQRTAAAQLGAVSDRYQERGRRIHVEVRVGEPALDNSHHVPLSVAHQAVDGLVPVVLDDVPEALRRSLWLTTDAAYRRALRALDEKQAQRASDVRLEPEADDFDTSPRLLHVGESPEALPPLERLEQLAADVSQVFRRYPAVHHGEVTVEAWTLERTVVTSEGSLGYDPARVTEVTIHCSGQAVDGMPIEFSQTRYNQLAPQQLRAVAEGMAQQLSELLDAPLASDYFGPVLFTDMAAAQIAHELLADSLSGTPGEQPGALARKLGKRVLPKSFDLVDDPTRQRLEAEALLGAYAFDDEGVLAQPVEIVIDGRLRGLLMSRRPRHEIFASNGHGRSGLFGWARGMVGNLILSSNRGLTREALERRLLEAVRAEGGEYGIVIERLQSRPYVTTGGAPPKPERVLRLYPDGRRVPVRGGSLGTMNVRDLRHILGAGDQPAVYNYLATQGGLSIPSAVAAPALLFEEVELRQPERSERLPKAIPRP